MISVIKEINKLLFNIETRKLCFILIFRKIFMQGNIHVGEFTQRVKFMSIFIVSIKYTYVYRNTFSLYLISINNTWLLFCHLQVTLQWTCCQKYMISIKFWYKYTYKTLSWYFQKYNLFAILLRGRSRDAKIIAIFIMSIQHIYNK